MTFDELFDILGEKQCREMHGEVSVQLSIADTRRILKYLTEFLEENDREDYFQQIAFPLKLKTGKDGKLCFEIAENKSSETERK